MLEENRLALLDNKFDLTPISLRFSGDMPIEEWIEYGKTLDRVEGAIQWWIGDYLMLSDKIYGETYAQAVDESQAHTWKNYKWVASKVDMFTRVESLSWSHHQTIASLSFREQGRWLFEAEKNEWSVKELRAAIDEGDAVLPASNKATKFGPKEYVINSNLSKIKETRDTLLLADRVPVVIGEEKPKFSFIYLLWDVDEVVYVGQTTQAIEDRVKSHVSSKQFDSYSCITVDPDDLTDTEIYLITTMKPKYNKACKHTQLLTRLEL
jgi:hypothetical protein